MQSTIDCSKQYGPVRSNQCPYLFVISHCSLWSNEEHITKNQGENGEQIRTTSNISRVYSTCLFILFGAGFSTKTNDLVTVWLRNTRSVRCQAAISMQVQSWYSLWTVKWRSLTLSVTSSLKGWIHWLHLSLDMFTSVFICCFGMSFRFNVHSRRNRKSYVHGEHRRCVCW